MTLHLDLPDGSSRAVRITNLWNAGYAGRSRVTVDAHVRELAELGVTPPGRIPAIYPLSPYLARQDNMVPVLHERTSGEAEWALVIAGEDADDVLITVACDHTDRTVETHSVLWGKNIAANIIGRRAWRWKDVENTWDDLRIRSWVSRSREAEKLIQDGLTSELLPPSYWLAQDEIPLRPGTVLLSGTIPMKHDVNQFGDHWRVELFDPTTKDTLSLSYNVVCLPTGFA